jgi:hypothetical protein
MAVMDTNSCVTLVVVFSVVAAVVAPVATWLSHLDDPEFEHND